MKHGNAVIFYETICNPSQSDTARKVRLAQMRHRYRVLNANIDIGYLMASAQLTFLPGKGRNYR